jgi:peptidoglycan lytic transglycosylase G
MFLRIAKTAFSLALLVVFAILLFVTIELYRPLSIAGGKAVFVVEKGMPAGSVAQALKDKGFIRARLPFVASYRLFFHPAKIKAGEYELVRPLREKGLLDILVKGRVMLHSVTIPEGLTSREVLPLVSPLLADGDRGFEAALHDTHPIAALDDRAGDLEGYLFPETYTFPRGVAAAEVLGTMVNQFHAVFGEPWKSRARELRMSVRQTVILASLIEKETSVPEEKRLVSAVFHNRLRIGMKLDCDPTVIYALKLKGSYAGRLSRQDMSLNSPYNTYLHAGLPPGPICNPGREALEAALYPAAEPYLYFVASGDGGHRFSRTFSEHTAAVRQYQKTR